jgi:hypothetical protein
MAAKAKFTIIALNVEPPADVHLTLMSNISPLFNVARPDIGADISLPPVRETASDIRSVESDPFIKTDI